MSLFKKYNDNKAGSTVSGSVLSINTLFNDTGLTQSVSKPNVNIGRAESSLFKKRQDTDARRIEKFINSPSGQNHSTKEIGFARSNPVFSPKGGIGDNPSRIINPRKVIVNTQYAGSGVFNDKFGLINISQDDGYSKYFKSDNSKLRYLYDKEVSPNLKINQEVQSKPEPGRFARFAQSTLNFLGTDIDSVKTKFNDFSTDVDNVSRAVGFRVPSSKLYEYLGGPGSDNGLGLTTIYRYENLDNPQFYTDKNTFAVGPDIENRSSNNFWQKTDNILLGNAEQREGLTRQSRFLTFDNVPTVSSNFESEYNSGSRQRDYYTEKNTFAVGPDIENRSSNNFWTIRTTGTIGNRENINGITRPSRFTTNFASSSRFDKISISPDFTSSYSGSNQLDYYTNGDKFTISPNIKNYKSNSFWPKSISYGLETGNIEKDLRGVERPSKFLTFAVNVESPDNRVINSDFASKYSGSSYYDFKRNNITQLSIKPGTKNYSANIFWSSSIEPDLGNIEYRYLLGNGNLSNVRPSKFVFFTDSGYGTYDSFFKSEYDTIFGKINLQPGTGNGKPKRFIASGSNLSSIFYENGLTNPPISDYYRSKSIRSWDGRTISNIGKFIDDYNSIVTGSRNASFVSASTNTTPAVENDDPDLIDFKLEIIDLSNSNGNFSYYLHFKAFIDSFTDDFKANYDTIAYPGNPSGKLYKYQSFDRNIGLTFKVAIFSESEFDQIYKKLNRLASTTLPTITDEAVRSTITKLTVGNWCKRLPGVVSGITFQNLVENPWDIDKGAPQILTINLSYLYSSTYEDTTKTFVTSRPGIGTTLFGPDAA